MLDYQHASSTFNDYVNQFDISDPKIKLKLVHTYGVVKASDYLATSLELNDEQHELAKVIALLHDIGRFEQLRQFNSFDDKNIDHALLGIDILNQNDFLRQFVSDNSYDDIIYAAIGNHSLYAIEENLDDESLLHAQIIRDADKLDNYRVKEIEDFETLFDVSEEELMSETLTPKIVEAYENHQLIARQDRKTHLDMWISYMAFMYDFNFDASLNYIKENDYIDKLFSRIHPSNEDVAGEFEKLRVISKDYVEKKLDKIQ